MTARGRTAEATDIGEVSSVPQGVPADDLIMRSAGLQSRPIEDAAAQAAMQPWFAMECYQLSRGSQVGRFESLDLGSQKVVRERQKAGVHKLGATSPDLCTISCCTTNPTARFSGHRAGDRGTIFFLPANTEFDLYIPVGAQTDYVSFNQEAFLRGARALDPARWERPFRHVTPLLTRLEGALRGALDLWLETAKAAAARGEALDPAILRDGLLDSVLRIVTATTREDPEPPPLHVRGLQVVRRARALVEDRLAADVLPTVVDICTALGVSERTLQYAFRDYVDMSPTAYLRLCRLSRARAALRTAERHETTVTQVAMRYGFLHLGRFSGDYQRIFGEMPSATLAPRHAG